MMQTDDGNILSLVVCRHWIQTFKRQRGSPSVDFQKCLLRHYYGSAKFENSLLRLLTMLLKNTNKKQETFV